MVIREQLPARRKSISFEFGHEWEQQNTFRYRATIGYHEDGRAGELFLNSSKRLGTALDANARDAAIFVSIALQYGAPLEVLRSAMARNSDGYPASPIGMALDEMIRRGLSTYPETPEPKTGGIDPSG